MTRIFDFATATAWEGRLQSLAAIAEDERWTYKSVPDAKPLPVLDNYVRFTFIRAFDQQKIVEADRVACFNTGLLTPGQEEIFGYLLFQNHTTARCRSPQRIRSGGLSHGSGQAINCSQTSWSSRN